MLTNAQVREAKPRTIRYEITCDSLPGFILRVLPTGKRVFFARYRDTAGKDHRERLGLMGPDFGADEARREAMAILAHYLLASQPSVSRKTLSTSAYTSCESPAPSTRSWPSETSTPRSGRCTRMWPDKVCTDTVTLA